MDKAATKTRKLIRSAEPAGGVRKLGPTAKLPTPAILRRLSPSDRETLDTLLATPQECIYHPSFRRSTMPVGNPDEPARQPAKPATHRRHEHPTEAIAVVGPTEVLTAGQERTLFLQFNYCRHRVMRTLRGFRGQRLTATATRELLKWANKAQQIRSEIAQANTSLVLAMARRSRCSGVEISELVSEGNLALLRCVDKFDAARGFKFSTYACRAILASFSRAGAKAVRYRVQFPTSYDPALERSDYLDVRREHIEYECVDELKRILFENAADLSPVERRVLDARFQLDSGDDSQQSKAKRRTLDQVGNLLGVSKERVRQIQNQAMDKLRAVLEERLLVAS